MKTLLAATLMLAATAVSADWEDVFQNPDLAINYEGYTTVSTVAVDPVQEAFPSNSDLFAGEEAGDVMNSGDTATSLDYITRGNPDSDCGCI
jgi:hypothetical protein